MAREFAKNAFLFLVDFEGLQKKLRILQDYNVRSVNIIEGLYAFAYSDHRLITRLERLQSIGIDDIRLSAINCTEEQFEEYFHAISQFNAGVCPDAIYTLQLGAACSRDG